MIDADKQRVLDVIDARADEYLELFRDLVRIVSTDPPGDERAMADACATYLRGLGMEVEQHEAEPKRTNNVARLRGSAGYPVLLFNSHLDTFPASRLDAWTHPPFAAEVHDGKVWGVGTRDMKAGLSAAMLAVRSVQDAGVALRGDVLITQTADHIRGGGVLGVKYLVDQGLVQADLGVYTEANPPARVEIASRGMIRFDVVVHGYAKHTKYKWERSVSGQPINAIAKAATVVQAIEAMTFTGWRPHPYVPGPPLISVNRIDGGFSDALIADRCTLRLDCRYLPGQDPDGVVADVQGVLDDLRAADPDLAVDLVEVLRGEACEVSPTSSIVRHVQSAVSDVRGHELELGGVGSTSDMRFLVNEAGIPMCKFMFPSSETGTNEFETVEDFLDTVRVYAMLLVDVLR